jgi:hypothetical protein
MSVKKHETLCIVLCVCVCVCGLTYLILKCYLEELMSNQ